MSSPAAPLPAATAAQPHHWLYIAALVVLWGSAFVATRIAAAVLAPFTITAIRLVLAGVLLIPAALILRRQIPQGRLVWGFLLGIALVGNCIPFSLLAWAQQRIDSGLAGICMAVMPLIVIVLAHIFVPGERLTARKLAGFVMGFIGIVVLIGPSALSEMGGDWLDVLSQLAALGAATCYGANAILTRRAPKVDPLGATACVMLIASVIMIPLALTLEPLPTAVDLSPAVATALLSLGIGSTGLATIVYFRGIADAGPSFISQINYLIPVYAVLLGAVLLGEQVPLQALIALAIILGGIAVSQGLLKRG